MFNQGIYFKILTAFFVFSFPMEDLVTRRIFARIPSFIPETEISTASECVILGRIEKKLIKSE